ncbi:MAG: carbohydrate kinase family protein [Planctomycetota bacterium]
MQGEPPEIVCVGLIVADVAVRPFTSLPSRGLVARVDHIGLRTGGDALNEAVVARRLGMRVRLIGKVGSDPLGDFVLRTLEGERIDTRGIVRSRTVETSACIVLIHPDGERSFLFHPGANNAFGVADVDVELLRGARCVSVASAAALPALEGEDLAGLLRKARSFGAKTFLDFTWDERGNWRETFGPALRCVDFLVPSYDEAAKLAGASEPREIGKALCDQGATAVVVKCDARGAYVYAPDDAGVPPEGCMVAALRVPVIDATGAGDAFVGGLMSALAGGMDLLAAVRFANAVAAIVIQRVGANEGAPSRAEVEELLARDGCAPR